jgi:putative salt-induced outer membrane protein YdiY
MKSAGIHRLYLAWLLGIVPLAAMADVLISTNGERFVGTILVETTNTVIFESGFAGRLTFAPAQIRKLEQAAPAETNAAPAPGVVAPAAVTRPSSATNLAWLPPGIGQDGADWIQLKSGEWLRGELKYIQEKDVEFDSDELEELSLKLKDIRQLYSAHRMLTQFEGQESIYGAVTLSNGVVTVKGPETVSMPREELTGITPGGGGREINYWSGKVNVGLTLQSGNSKQTTVNTSAELARRTPDTRFLLEYLGNYSEVNDTKNANDDRVNLTYDIRLNRDWFVRPVEFECYHDPLANIAYRLTAGVGAGYYIFNRDGLEWIVSAGPGFQYTRFDSVEPGEPDSSSTPAGVLQTSFEYDLTRRLTFIQTVQAMMMDREAGQFTHHAVSTLEFEIKRHLDLDVSFIWDYLRNPQSRSDGSVPENNDYYLTVGFGVRF